MKRLLSAAVLTITGVAAVLPTATQAQSSASPYTSATRYDAMGRAVGTIAPDPDGYGPLKHLATRTTYDARGNVTKVETGELQSWKAESVLPANWGADFDNHIQSTAETTYDAMNRKLTDRAKGSDGVTISLTQYSYDTLGRLECTAVRMNPAAYNSLPADACTLGNEGTQGPDRITRTVYDAFGQVLQIRKAVGTSVEIADVTYSYTPSGQIEQVIDANGNRAELRYDGHDRQTRWVFPSKTRPSNFDNTSASSAMSSAGALNESDYEAYTYDDNGNRLSLRKRDGSVINYTYDALNRITFKDLPFRADLPSWLRRDVYYEYDLRGLQTSARFWQDGSGGRVDYTFDGFGRVVAESQTNSGGITRNISSQYDKNGNRTRMTYPDGAFASFTYDGLNRLDRVRQATSALGGMVYNARGLPSKLEWPVSTASDNERTYGYDNAGRLDQIGINIFGTAHDVTWGYTRNPASQIRTETQSNDSYSWDGHVDLNRNYTTNGLNQYTGAGSAAFCYDANGNLTADGSSVYLYDIENRLVEKRVQTNTNCSSLSYSGTRNALLQYDPTGRLINVSGGSQGAQLFTYDGNALVAEYNSSGTILRRYVHGSNIEADDPLVWYEGSAMSSTTRRYIHADPRGSIVAVTNRPGSLIAVNSYDEYGIPDTASGDDISTKGRFRYTGQVWLPELGMYYYKARIYSPTLGRFLQTDPIGYGDGLNIYNYVGGDPLNAVDPTGLYDTDAHCRVVGQTIIIHLFDNDRNGVPSEGDTHAGSSAIDKVSCSFGHGGILVTASGLGPGNSSSSSSGSSVCPVPELRSSHDLTEDQLRWREPGWILVQVWRTYFEAYDLFDQYYPLEHSRQENQEGDAFRHFAFSFLLTRRTNRNAARRWGDAHENTVVNAPSMRTMDFHNNSMGRAFASNSRFNDLHPIQAFDAALKAGCILVLRDTPSVLE